MYPFPYEAVECGPVFSVSQVSRPKVPFISLGSWQLMPGDTQPIRSLWAVPVREAEFALGRFPLDAGGLCLDQEDAHLGDLLWDLMGTR